jgi:hypothetical protein
MHFLTLLQQLLARDKLIVIIPEASPEGFLPLQDARDRHYAGAISLNRPKNNAKS